MGERIRTINKIGKGKYFTTNYKISEYLIYNILYFIFIYSFYLIFKYFFYLPIKWCVKKIIGIIKSKNKNNKIEE